MNSVTASSRRCAMAEGVGVVVPALRSSAKRFAMRETRPMPIDSSGKGVRTLAAPMFLHEHPHTRTTEIGGHGVVAIVEKIELGRVDAEFGVEQLVPGVRKIFDDEAGEEVRPSETKLGSAGNEGDAVGGHHHVSSAVGIDGESMLDRIEIDVDESDIGDQEHFDVSGQKKDEAHRPAVDLALHLRQA